MQVISLAWGILAVVGMVIGFIPCLGALNWINIPFAGVGLAVSGIAIATARGQPRGPSIAGTVCCAAALFFGFLRLCAGYGVL